MKLKDYRTPSEMKHQTYEMYSKAELTSYRAKIWFQRPAYGIYQGRRYEDDRNGQNRVYNPDEGSE